MASNILLPVVLAITSSSFAVTTISTTSLPNGLIKDSYLAVVNATGGCAPYTWKIASGALPTGVTMKTSSNTSSVTLSGTPSKATTYSFTLSATGCGGHAAQASYQVKIQTAADHTVDLSWKASTRTDVAGYNIYRGPDGKSWTRINASLAASTVYTDSTVADSSIYYYSATAVDIKGVESKKSNIAKSVIP